MIDINIPGRKPKKEPPKWLGVALFIVALVIIIASVAFGIMREVLVLKFLLK